jgi:dihydropteroate synthase
MNRINYDLWARDTQLSLGPVTRIMGIVNCTPDSFSGDGKLDPQKGTKGNTAACLHFARKLIREGADILDIGGESTRPGSRGVPVEEELRRVIPVIKVLARESKAPISVDTSKLSVARSALDAGASIVNNIRGTQMSTGFLKMVRDYKACIVIMHMRGTPATMHQYAHYKNVVLDVIKELQISIEKCLEIGIKKERIIVDPGIGFSKSADQCLCLINHLNRFNILHCPILLGTSRKSFIGHVLDKGVEKRLMGTAATVTAGAMQGAHIVRVHEVKATKEILKVTDAILNAHA